jgi:aminoglycoside 3-N-acetyltransferase
MTLADRIADMSGPPVTASGIAEALAHIGLRAGDVVMVHVSLGTLGYVVGGAFGVIDGITRAVGPAGTVVMPAFTGDLSDPHDWVDPAVPPDWWPVLREAMPPFDPASSATWGLGVTAELFRTQPGVVRGPHPRASFAARGPDAAAIVAPHPLRDMFGEGSPLARLYDRGARVLLLGVDHGANTAMHLAEHRAPRNRPRRVPEAAPVMTPEGRRWVRWRELDHSADDFPMIGEDFEASGNVAMGSVGAGLARLMDLPELVDFAARWIAFNRG